ncbi:FG-GAP-like repeat-containing protein [Tautonia rosea]|uniref:FG-GAP-like repeat-containing protein n=1 Tax=Tautonia rosea TaxID=2728037 RepID=UPI001475464D|nr:FG-GAP-like repeat-containing protein [Tautonia rosea]
MIADLAEIKGMAVQADGGSVLVGTISRAGNDDFVVIRFEPNGQLDTSFGTMGMTIIAFDLGANESDRAQGVAVQPDGKILVVGPVEQPGGQRDFGIARLEANGQIDLQFGIAGRIVVGFNRSPIVTEQDDIARAVVVQPDGKILVVGSVDDLGDENDFGLVRLNPDGALDSTFAESGRAVIAFDLGASAEDQDDDATGVAVQSDGRIVVTGSVRTMQRHRDFGFARLRPEGDLDLSFGQNGKVVLGFDLGSTPDRRHDDPTALVIQPDGKVVAAGTILRDNGQSDFGILRLNANGTPDPSFGQNGRVHVNVGAGDRDLAVALAHQGDGRLLVAGDVQSARGDSDFGVIQLSSTGQLVGTFGQNGRVIIPFNLGPRSFDHDRTRGAGLDGNGALLVAGQVDDGQGDLLAGITRLFVDRSPTTVLRVGPVVPDVRRFPVSSVDVQFSEAILPSSFQVSALRLLRNGEQVPLGPGVTLVNSPGSPAIFRIDGLSEATARSGTYELWVDASGVQDLAGNPGQGASSTVYSVRRKAVPADYDGDGISDVSTYSVVGGIGRFEIWQSSDQRFRVEELGSSGDFPVDADFDGDGIIDLAVFGYTPSLGYARFLYRQSSDGATRSIPFGGPFDFPLAGDFDGDGLTDIAVFGFSPNEGFSRFGILLSDTRQAFSRPFGGPFDFPVTGDFDGDWRTDIAVYGYSPRNGYSRFAILPSMPNDLTFSQAVGAYPVPFGGLNDSPVVGDFDGDGRTDLAVYGYSPRNDFSRFGILFSSGHPTMTFPFGGSGDVPVAGDYDGDGRTDLAVFGFSPNNGFHRFAILPSGGAPARTVRFGSFGAIGLPAFPGLFPLSGNAAMTGSMASVSRLASAPVELPQASERWERWMTRHRTRLRSLTGFEKTG